jgi:uncharacterized protein (DUF486 family)
MRTVLLLIASNLFMNVAWYWHLLVPSGRLPLWGFIAISWLIALPEYCLAVPANRWGSAKFGGQFTAPQLKVLQEGLTLAVFVIVSLCMLGEAPKARDYLGMGLILAGVIVVGRGS